MGTALILAVGHWGWGEAPGAAGERPRSLVFHRVAGNLLQNSSFEHNWFNRAFTMGRRFLLLQASDMGMAEQDGHIDHWRFQGIPIPESWDTAVARAGTRSVRFTKAGKGSQLVRFAGEQFWQAGGAHYASFMPMAEVLADQVAKRPIIVGAWCRTQDVPKGGEPTLSVHVLCGARASFKQHAADPTVGKSVTNASVAFSPGTHDWEYKEARIEPDDLKGTPFYATVTIASPGKGGTVWFDDASCVEEPDPSQPNRVANASFEALDGQGYPTGWSRPTLWTWWRNDYYLFTGWSHSEAKTWRGSAVADRMLAFRGNASLRFTVFPGDNFAVASDPIALNQDRPRPIEVRAMVKADNLRTLEIMAQDESGQWLPQGDFLGDDAEEPGHYNFGTTGAGTYDWFCVRKYFSPRRPIRSLRLFLCVRGFDGVIVERNLVGTLWVDDLHLFEHGIPKEKIPAASIPVQPREASYYPFRVVDIELGDRLWGKNVVRLALEFEGKEALERLGETSLLIKLATPKGQSKRIFGEVRILAGPSATSPKGYALASGTFEVQDPCKSWQEQYQVSFGFPVRMAGLLYAGYTFSFGTPSRLIATGASVQYPYPEETPVAFANLNVARGSFPDLGRCEFVLTSGPQERKLLVVDDFSKLLQPQTAPEFVNARNLIQAKLTSEGFIVHPWSEPVLDNVVAVRLYDKAGKLLAEGDPIRFGFLSRFPKPDLPEAIERTAVNDRGYITVNGKPFFPVYWTPHFGICPEANWPPNVVKFKTLDITSIVCAKEKMPDEEVKAKLLAKIAEVKNDPKLFQYELGDGEMQLQGEGWKERLAWCKKAIPWIREADPNHLINGPSSWLVGHPGHNEAMQAFIPDWDAIGVETSFEAVPKINQLARPLMKVRKTAVLVGLETYFYQSNEVLRWRGYRAILDGAAGIGLCPSGMMQSRPDKVNYLRGLNGEFRGLAPILTADEPPQKCTLRVTARQGARPPDALKLIDTMERLCEGKRYVFAVRNRDDAGPLRVRFDFPKGERYSGVRVRFEGRTIQPSGGGFEDDFAEPQTVHVYELER